MNPHTSALKGITGVSDSFGIVTGRVSDWMETLGISRVTFLAAYTQLAEHPDFRVLVDTALEEGRSKRTPRPDLPSHRCIALQKREAVKLVWYIGVRTDLAERWEGESA